jgi:PPOX class probable F420-dependent enzyme
MSYPFREMSPQAIAVFLAESRHALLATNRKGKAPLLGPVWYLFDEGRLHFGVLSTTAKYRHLSRDPNVSLCIDGGHPDARAVIFYGTAEVLKEPREASDEIERRIARRYLPNDDEVQRYLRQTEAVGETALFIVTPNKIVARDYN